MISEAMEDAEYVALRGAITMGCMCLIMMDIVIFVERRSRRGVKLLDVAQFQGIPIARSVENRWNLLRKGSRFLLFMFWAYFSGIDEVIIYRHQDLELASFFLSLKKSAYLYYY
jgi:hypothetical protein